MCDGPQTRGGDSIGKGNALGTETLPLPASLKQSKETDLGLHGEFTSKTQREGEDLRSNSGWRACDAE